MTGGQEKNFSSLGPKLRDNRAQQYYGDKTLQIRVVLSDYKKDILKLSIYNQIKTITLLIDHPIPI